MPDHKVADVIPKSRGLRNLKAEIMKSNTVFTGYIEPHESRIPKRSSNAQCLTEGASLERDSSFQGNNQLKLFKMYIGHKDGEVN